MTVGFLPIGMRGKFELLRVSAFLLGDLCPSVKPQNECCGIQILRLERLRSSHSVAMAREPSQNLSTEERLAAGNFTRTVQDTEESHIS